MKLKLISAILISLILLSCSSGFRPAGDEIRDQSCGRVYTQEEAQELVLENLKWMFKNYESAKIEFTDIKKAFIDYEIGNRVIFGYSINAVINTKSIDGVYSGDRTHLFFLKDNKVFYNYTKPDTKLKKAYWIEVKPDISE
jgi:hypothetical protein